MSENDNVSELLEHHGILGMKWGVRRTPAQLGHAPAKQNEPKIGDKPAAKKESSKPQRAGKMSDDELRTHINRLNMERQYRDLEASLNPKKKSAIKLLLGEAAMNLGRKALGVAVDKAVASIFKETEFRVKDLDKMDLSEMTPSMLKKASETYQNAGKIYNWRKQMSGSADQSAKGSADKSAKGSAEPQITKAETANTKKSFPSLKLYRGQAFVGTVLKQRTSAYTSDSFSKGMSFTQKYLYGKSGSDDRNEKLAFQKYETKKSERVEKAVAYTQKRLDEQRKANAERDMRRLGL